MKLTLSVTRDQALVLFEWLSREDGKNTMPTEHQAEQKVLWEIEGQLERLLVEPLQPNYSEAAKAVRERILSGDTDGGVPE